MTNLLLAIVVATVILSAIRLNWWYWVELPPEERKLDEDDMQW